MQRLTARMVAPRFTDFVIMLVWTGAARSDHQAWWVIALSVMAFLIIVPPMRRWFENNF